MTPIHDPNNYWEQLERLEKLIRASEIKAGIIFSFHSLVLGLFFERFEKLEPMLQSSIAVIIITFLWFISVLISIFYCFKCFKPQIELKYDKNVFFFGDAAKAFGSAEDYTKKLIEVCSTEEQLVKQLGEQIHVESKIIDAKFKSVQRSMKFFGLSVVFFVLIMAYWLIIPF
ncbi:Pycsar system effector family protein [Yeosuana sp.]|uniref:Pycsar system effector family protein n=1 Tax=Yeosuana sp. TaxID=2529388 RepID=UPI0040551EB8|tara:strand:- start:722 stop:1237 length:516 start_codon:yes stop_codon:yes gene_type:complete